MPARGYLGGCLERGRRNNQTVATKAVAKPGIVASGPAPGALPWVGFRACCKNLALLLVFGDSLWSLPVLKRASGMGGDSDRTPIAVSPQSWPCRPGHGKIASRAPPEGALRRTRMVAGTSASRSQSRTVEDQKIDRATSKNIPLWRDERGSSSRRGGSLNPWPRIEAA